MYEGNSPRKEYRGGENMEECLNEGDKNTTIEVITKVAEIEDFAVKLPTEALKAAITNFKTCPV